MIIFFYYTSQTNKSRILNPSTVGQPLVVSTRGQKLVSKKKQEAAKQGRENRLAYLDMAEKYKDIMKKK